MKNSAKILFVLVGLMATITACSAESARTSEASELTPVDPTQLALSDDPGAPGEDPNLQDKGNGRVYIQYCDRPNNSAGTICRTYDGTINWSTDPDECRRDTQNVCGGPTATWILCAGPNCWYM
ncbi:MAG TPA: hypothetical protein VFQ61_00025 [Polyangiaceae bacterium]|nr:hypothetical protein [Polyangiaceae bacterium]